MCLSTACVSAMATAFRKLCGDGSGGSAGGGEPGEQCSAAGPGVPAHHALGAVGILVDDELEHDMMLAITPLMKGDEEVVDLKRKFDTAVENHPEVRRPELMVLRHTHVHSPEEPDAWRPAAEAISRFYRTFDAWFGNKTTPENGFLEPSPESKFEGRPEFEPESLHKTAMIGTPDEVIQRLRHYEELGVDEFSFWCDNSLPHEEKRKSLELFIKEVVPAFQ
jgi:alkanesulfonate monooxygenase SsuD/methylene tetrahydromethanopterin reductase-like flavin-dependent oxidoreductase (luciferase family)